MLSSGVLSKLSSTDPSSALQGVGIHPETPPAAVFNNLNEQVTPEACLHEDHRSCRQLFYDTGVPWDLLSSQHYSEQWERASE